MSTNPRRMSDETNRIRKEYSRNRETIFSLGRWHVHSSKSFSLSIDRSMKFFVQGEDVQRELIERIEHLGDLCNELTIGDQALIVLLKPAIEFYLQSLEHFHRSSIVTNEEDLPVIKYLLANGNTSVYQWRTGGQRPVSLERPAFNYQSIEKDNEEDLVLDLDLSDGQNVNTDLIESIEGIEIKQTSDQQENIDFETVRINFNEKRKREKDRCLGRWNRLVSDRYCSWITRSCSFLERQSSQFHPGCTQRSGSQRIQQSSKSRLPLRFSFSFCLFLFNLVDDGIARGADALTLLENRPTYTLFLQELTRVSFSLLSAFSTLFGWFSASIVRQTTSEWISCQRNDSNDVHHAKRSNIDSKDQCYWSVSSLSSLHSHFFSLIRSERISENDRFDSFVDSTTTIGSIVSDERFEEMSRTIDSLVSTEENIDREKSISTERTDRKGFQCFARRTTTER